MALSTAIFVGKSQEWIPEIVERAKQLKTNAGKEGEGRRGRGEGGLTLNCSQSSGHHGSGSHDNCSKTVGNKMCE